MERVGHGGGSKGTRVRIANWGRRTKGLVALRGSPGVRGICFPSEGGGFESRFPLQRSPPS